MCNPARISQCCINATFHTVTFQCHGSPTAAAVLAVGRLVQSPMPNTFGYLVCWRVSLSRSNHPASFASGLAFTTELGPIGGVTWSISYFKKVRMSRNGVYDVDEVLLSLNTMSNKTDYMTLTVKSWSAVFLSVTVTSMTLVSPGLSRFSNTASFLSARTSIRLCRRFTSKFRCFTISHNDSAYFLIPNSTGSDVL